MSDAHYVPPDDYYGLAGTVDVIDPIVPGETGQLEKLIEKVASRQAGSGSVGQAVASASGVGTSTGGHPQADAFAAARDFYPDSADTVPHRFTELGLLNAASSVGASAGFDADAWLNSLMGSAGRTVVDRGANSAREQAILGSASGRADYLNADLDAYREFMNQELEIALQHIGDQFTSLRGEIDSRRQEAEGSIAEARESALSSLLGLRSDLEGRNAEAAAGQGASTDAAVGRVSDVAGSLLGDLAAQGVDGSELAARVAEQQARLITQGERQSSLLDRLAEVNDAALGRSEGRSATIEQGAQSNLAAAISSMLSQADRDQADAELDASAATRAQVQSAEADTRSRLADLDEDTRQRLLEATLNPITRRVGGSSGAIDSGDRLLIDLLRGQGMSAEEATLNVLAGQVDNILSEGRAAARDAAVAPEVDPLALLYMNEPDLLAADLGRWEELSDGQRRAIASSRVG